MEQANTRIFDSFRCALDYFLSGILKSYPFLFVQPNRSTLKNSKKTQVYFLFIYACPPGGVSITPADNLLKCSTARK